MKNKCKRPGHVGISHTRLISYSSVTQHRVNVILQCPSWKTSLHYFCVSITVPTYFDNCTMRNIIVEPIKLLDFVATPNIIGTYRVYFLVKSQQVTNVFYNKKKSVTLKVQYILVRNNFLSLNVYNLSTLIIFTI